MLNALWGSLYYTHLLFIPTILKNNYNCIGLNYSFSKIITTMAITRMKTLTLTVEPECNWTFPSNLNWS